MITEQIKAEHAEANVRERWEEIGEIKDWLEYYNDLREHRKAAVFGRTRAILEAQLAQLLKGWRRP